MPTDDHVKVGVRIKPCDGPSSCEGDTLQNKVVLARSAHGAARRYTFDHVFDEQATNAELYQSVGAPLLHSALDGYNATLLAYGQTGAGKTHTIMGQGREDPGVVMRLVSQLFDAADKQGKHIQFSMLEIYNERIRDLFSVRRASTESLRIREDPATGPFVENLSWFVAEDREAMQELLSIGAEARTVRSTHNNQQSSRAHTVVQIAITPLQSGGKSNNTGSSMICVVDLAGSERHDASGAVGAVGPKTLREGCSINKSLTNLGLCISALVAAGPGGAGREGNQSPRRLAALGLSPGALRPGGQRVGKSHIPYRNSALTWLLRESIGGNSKTAILACVNPEPRHREESLSTLRFADRAKQLTTRVDRNINVKASASRAARRDRILREHGVFAVGSDAQATIDALREEVRRLESTLQAHGADSGQGGAPYLVPGGLITTVNGRKVEGSADRPFAFKHGDRVTVWDPASQQEHAFLHLKSTEAPKERLAHERTAQPVVAVASEEEQNQETAHAEAEHAAAALNLDSSMVSFLEAEEMAYESRSRRLSLDSSLPLVLNRPTLAQAEQRSIPENSSASQPVGSGERKVYMDSLHRHKKRRARQSRVALKTSAVACAGRDNALRSATEDWGTASRYDALMKCSSSWAPCAVFVIGCGSAAVLPSTVQDDEPQLAQDDFSSDAMETGLQMQQPMSPVEPTSTVIDWAPSVIGVLGWTMLVYTILRRWRRWLASQTSQIDKRSQHKTATRLGQPRATKESVGKSEIVQKRHHHRQRDAGRASTDLRTDDAERQLRRRQRYQCEVTGRDQAIASGSTNLDRRQDRRRQRNHVYRSSESGSRTTDAHGKDMIPIERHQHRRQQRQPNAELAASLVGNDQMRCHHGRNHFTASAKPLQDKTNTATRNHGDTVPPRSEDAGKDRRQQQQRERVNDKYQHGQRVDEAWKEQCCDALAV